jgi:bacteriorhodopsin
MMQTVNVLKFIGWAVAAPIIVFYFIENRLTLETPDQQLLALVLGVAGVAVAIIQRGK